MSINSINKTFSIRKINKGIAIFFIAIFCSVFAMGTQAKETTSSYSLSETSYISISAGKWTTSPGLLTQKDGRCAYFYWSQPQSANTYTLQLSTLPTMASPVNVTVTDSAVNVNYFYSKLKVKTTYYYRVKPTGVNFPDWSTIRTFTTPDINATDLVCAGAV